MDDDDLEIAETQLASLLSKCEAVLRNTTLSASRRTLMTNRVRALRTALALVEAERECGSTERTDSS